MAVGSVLGFYKYSFKPSAPPSGSVILYIKTDNVIYVQDSSGTEYPFASADLITALHGDVSATGPGDALATVNTVGGKLASEIAQSVTDTQAATNLNTPSTIVKRDASGNFNAGVITASLTGNVTGSASNNVLKAGDTMTGALQISVNSLTALKVGTSVFVVDTTNNRIGINKLSPTEALDVVGNGNFTGNVIALNLSGTNTGDVTVNPVGSSPNANGVSLSGQSLTLQPADGTHPGLLTILAQSIAGIKTFLSQLLVSDTTQSTNKDTGSIVTEGGIGVEKNINAGGNIVATGTVTGSNFSGSTSGTNTGDVTILDTNSIDLTLSGQQVSADLRLSTDAADAGNLKATTTIHSGAGAGLHVEVPFATPVQIGTSNNPGSASSVSLSDHVHAVTSSVILNLLLTGYVIGSNTIIAATDSILIAFEKLQGQISSIAGSAITALTGDVTATGPGSVVATIPAGTVTDAKGALATKPAVTVVATTNQTLSGTPTIDGQATTANQSIVLLTAQSTGSQNGPWVVQTGAWTRPTWYPTGGTSQAFQFITSFVRLGTTYQGSVWRLTTSGVITIDTTTTTWVVTPISGNYKTNFNIGPATGSSAVNLNFENALTGVLSWNPSSGYTITLPPSSGAAGTTLLNDGSGNLSWTNIVSNVDGGNANSVYTVGQAINGGTP